MNVAFTENPYYLRQVYDKRTYLVPLKQLSLHHNNINSTQLQRCINSCCREGSKAVHVTQPVSSESSAPLQAGTPCGAQHTHTHTHTHTQWEKTITFPDLWCLVQQAHISSPPLLYPHTHAHTLSYRVCTATGHHKLTTFHPLNISNTGFLYMIYTVCSVHVRQHDPCWKQTVWSQASPHTHTHTHTHTLHL